MNSDPLPSTISDDDSGKVMIQADEFADEGINTEQDTADLTLNSSEQDTADLKLNSSEQVDDNTIIPENDSGKSDSQLTPGGKATKKTRKPKSKRNRKTKSKRNRKTKSKRNKKQKASRRKK